MIALDVAMTMEGVGTPDLSHDALALDMGERSWDEGARYVAHWSKWMFWSGVCWTKDETREAMTRTRTFVGKRATELLIWSERLAKTLSPAEARDLLTWAKREARRLRDKQTVAAVESLAQSNPQSRARPEDFDTNLMLLGTPKGTVELRTGRLRPARREDMVTRLTQVAPAPGAPTGWLSFLDEIFAGDQELITFLQRVAGYALTGETREHKLFFCYGTGRNGKSVFLNTLEHIAGDYARRAPATLFLSSQGEKHPTDLAGLQGARVVVGSELPRGKSWDEAAIKDLTGGDVITARFMRGDFFDYMPQFTLLIAGNTMPSFTGVDEALRARVVLIPFTVTIPPEKRDPLLPETLKKEAGQILQWMIEGAVAWHRGGLKVPDRVAVASRDYLDEEDTLGQFLVDETRPDSTAFVASSDLHLRFQQWCSRQGLPHGSMHLFVKELKARGLQDKRLAKGRGFVGLKLT